jgi:hypothetical protein
MRLRPIALLLTLSACGDGALPPPRILSIDPSEMVACEGATVTVSVDAILPTNFDYAQSAATANPDVSLRIGAVPVGSGRYAPGGLLMAAVPPVLSPGTYDVGLRLSDGRPEAVLWGGFAVRANPYPDSYLLDFVPDQTQGQPFPITLRAVGSNAPIYNCAVALTSDHGAISPRVSGNFQLGVRTERVTIDRPFPAVVITVRDEGGGSGSSNPFRVAP